MTKPAILGLAVLLYLSAQPKSQSGSSAPSPQTSPIVIDYLSRNVEQKVQLLSSVAANQSTPSAGDVVALASAASAEENPRLRSAGLNMIAGRVTSVFFQPTAGALLQAKVDQPHFLDLRNIAVAGLADSDASVRDNAVFALVGLDFAEDADRSRTSKTPPRLRRDTASLLATHFDSEPDGRVRARILSAFISMEDGRIAETDAAEPLPALVRAGLNDPSPSVKQAAASLTRQVPSASDQLVPLLADADPGVRRSALINTTLRPRIVAKFEAEIRQALALETNPHVKAAVEAALAAAQTGRAR